MVVDWRNEKETVQRPRGRRPINRSGLNMALPLEVAQLLMLLLSSLGTTMLRYGPDLGCRGVVILVLATRNDAPRGSHEESSINGLVQHQGHTAGFDNINQLIHLQSPNLSISFTFIRLSWRCTARQTANCVLAVQAKLYQWPASAPSPGPPPKRAI